MGVSFDVKPTLTIKPDNQVSATVKLSTQKWGSEWNCTLADSMVRDGLSTNGLRLGLKAKTVEVEYGVQNNDPKLIFRSSVTVKDKDVGLKYTHAVKAGSSLEASVPVDDDNKATITYDLTGFDNPDYRKLTLKWSHTQKDFLIEPSFNLGTESLHAAVTYKVDDDNKVKATYDTKSNVGTLEWTNTSGIAGDGDLKVTARSALDQDSVKKMPTVMVEKTWSISSD